MKEEGGPGFMVKDEEKNKAKGLGTFWVSSPVNSYRSSLMTPSVACTHTHVHTHVRAHVRARAHTHTALGGSTNIKRNELTYFKSHN